jgi:hypothetical protein
MADSEPTTGERPRDGRTDGVGVYLSPAGQPSTLPPLGGSQERPVPAGDPRRPSTTEAER